LTVFALVWLRLLARVVGRVPPIVPPPPGWQLHVAHAVELAIYVFMIAMPLMGWAILSAEGERVSFFGLGLPPLIRENEQLASQLEELHELVGNFGYFLIGIHAA